MVGDLSLVFEQLQAVHVGDEQRSGQLRHRYLALLLDALHAPQRRCPAHHRTGTRLAAATPRRGGKSETGTRGKVARYADAQGGALVPVWV